MQIHSSLSSSLVSVYAFTNLLYSFGNKKVSGTKSYTFPWVALFLLMILTSESLVQI